MRCKRDPQWLVLPLWTVFLLFGSAQRCPAQSTNDPQLYGYEVVAEYPHDPYAFTQGADTLCNRENDVRTRTDRAERCCRLGV